MFTRHLPYRFILPALLLSAGMVSCSDDDTPEPSVIQTSVNWNTTSNTYDSDGIWSDNADAVPLYGGPFVFSHSISEWDTVEGFTLSRSSDTDWYDEMYLHAYTVPAGGGPEGRGTPFVVGFWSSREGTEPQNRSCAVSMRDGSSFIPGEIYVTNDCYAYYIMRRGNDFSKPFGDGDWFRVTAHGVGTDGTESETSFYLARCGADPAEGIVSTWEKWDLSVLGEVTSVYFTLDSSDSDELWGMNTPAFFAISGMSCLTT